MTIGIVKPVRIEDEMKGAYLDYAMSVITARALPDVRDGLKPVQRRILYSMEELNLHPTAAYKKSARIVGEVMGKYHPHGDAPIYEAMVRLAQDFSMRYPLVDGQGNFGSVDGDPPAAMRYTEARLAALAEEMLADIDKETVNFSPNFDDTLKEPVILPSKLPNLLVNGSAGIAVGMATNIPPHNLNEVAGALNDVIGRLGQAIDGGAPFGLVWARVFNNPVDPALGTQALAQLKPALKQRVDAAARKLGTGEEHRVAALVEAVDDLIDVTPARLMEFVKGPDFPTAGIILGVEGIKNAYATGHGRITIRAKAHVEDMRGGRKQIVVNELPFQVNKAALLEKIAELVRDRRVDGISELRDESDRQGMRVVIELRREAHPRQILNQLFKYTAMQTSFSVNMLALVDGQPRVLTLKMALLHYVSHRREVITRRTQFDLAKAKHRAHILEGLKIALDNLDEVIATIRRSKDADAARGALIKGFKLSEIQAQAILDMQLRRLAALERQKIRDELTETLALIKRLEDLLANPVKILYLIRDELSELKAKFGDARRTQIVTEEVAEFTEEDLVPDQETLVTVTAKGYMKRAPAEGFRTQRRGAKGIAGAVSKEDDPPVLFALASSRDNLLLFSGRGRAYQVKVYDLPEAARQARGLPAGNFVTLDEQERIVAALPVAKLENRFLVLATQRGEVKRVSAAEFSGARAAGIAGYAVPEGDELIGAVASSGHQDILLATTKGQSIRFGEAELRPSGRGSGGVRGIRPGDGDHVASIDVVHANAFVAIVTRKGFGKRTAMDEFSKQGRGGGGIRAANVSVKNGEVIAGRVVVESDELVLVSSGGTMLRLPASSLPETGRAVIGAPVMTLARDEKVMAVGVIPPKDKSDEPAKPGPSPAAPGEGGTGVAGNPAGGASSAGENGIEASAAPGETEGGSEMLPGAKLAKAVLRRAVGRGGEAKADASATTAASQGKSAKSAKSLAAAAGKAPSTPLKPGKTASAASAKSAARAGESVSQPASSASRAKSSSATAAKPSAKAGATPQPAPSSAKASTSANRPVSDSSAPSKVAARVTPDSSTSTMPATKAPSDLSKAAGLLKTAATAAAPKPSAQSLDAARGEAPTIPVIPSATSPKPVILSRSAAQAKNLSSGEPVAAKPAGAPAAHSSASAPSEPVPNGAKPDKAKAGKQGKPEASPTLLRSLAQTVSNGLKAAQSDLDKRQRADKKARGSTAKGKQPQLPM